MTRKTTELIRMGRRRFLETLAALGLSTQAVQGMSKEKLEQLTGDPTREVPLVSAIQAKNPERYKTPPLPDEPADRETEYYTVSRDRWVRMESAYDAARRVQNKLDQAVDVPERIASGVTKSVRGRHEQYTVTIDIQRPDAVTGVSAMDVRRQGLLDQVKDIIPPEVYGAADATGETTAVTADAVSEQSSAAVEEIPVEYRFIKSTPEADPADEATCEHLNSADHFQHPYHKEFNNRTTYVASGSAISINDDDGWGGTCTLGPRVYSSNYNEYMFLSAAHCAIEYDDERGKWVEDPSDAYYRDVGQPDGSHRIGAVKFAKHYGPGSADFPMDAMLIATTGDYLPSTRLASDEPGESETFHATGIIGRDRLRDLGYNDTMIQQGARSGRCERTVRTVRDNWSGGDEILLDRPFNDGEGDSGGPYFVDDGNELLVAGIHQRGGEVTVSRDPSGRKTYQQNVAEGMYIGDIENEFDVQVN